MTQSRAKSPRQPAVPEHGHPEYGHDGHAHSHEVHEHEHIYEFVPHEHSTVLEHEHGPHVHAVPKHEHSEPSGISAQLALRGELRGAVRALLRVFEAGQVNSVQRQAIHAARVVIGDARGSGCTHGKDPDGLYRNATYGAGDRLVCDLCGTDITAEVGG